MKSLDDLLKESGATLEGTEPRVAQLEADEMGLSTTWLDLAGDGGREGGTMMGTFARKFGIG